jgi:hypothetical protein
MIRYPDGVYIQQQQQISRAATVKGDSPRVATTTGSTENRVQSIADNLTKEVTNTI